MTTTTDSIQAQSDALIKEDALAQSKGDSPEHRLARQNVAKLFCRNHLPAESPAQIDARLALIDYALPVTSTNARNLDINNPKAKGLFGMGRKPAYILSQALPPKNPEDPIYALEYTPIKR